MKDYMSIPDTGPVQDGTVYRSPEFQAFCKRFGIAWGLRTVGIVLTIPLDGLMMIQQTYQATDEVGDPPIHVDTSTLHNEVWRTNEPAERQR